MDITGVRAERPPARDVRRDLWGGLAVAVLGGVQVGHALEPAVAAAAGGRLRAWVPVLLGLALVAAAVAQVAGAVAPPGVYRVRAAVPVLGVGGRPRYAYSNAVEVRLTAP